VQDLLQDFGVNNHALAVCYASLRQNLRLCPNGLAALDFFEDGMNVGRRERMLHRLANGAELGRWVSSGLLAASCSQGPAHPLPYGELVTAGDLPDLLHLGIRK
jgi:hypothetical protein